MNDKAVLIIADDLSGAADASSAFAMAGLTALIALDAGTSGAGLLKGAQVLAIDTDSRRLDAVRAGEVQLACWQAHRANEPLLFKKMDSTLRGHFAAETRALIPQAGMAIVAPAFPAARRFTRGGRQFIDGTSMELSGIWRNEGLSGSAHLPTLLEAHGIRTAQLSLDDLRQDAGFVRQRLLRHADSGVQAVVCDAEEDGDLKAIVQASVNLEAPHFWVGSAGLSPHLAQSTGLSAPAPAAAEVRVQGPILTVVGSASAISRAQVDHLQADAPHERIDLPVAMLRDGESHGEWGAIAQACNRALRDGHDVLVVIRADEPVDLSEGARLSQSLARLFEPLAAIPGAVIATGGETARAVLTAMGVKVLHLLGDVEPGVPLSVALGERRMPIITKAGAFGSVQTLSHCHQHLRRARLAANC